MLDTLGWTEEQYKVHFQRSRQVYAHIDFLDFQTENIIGNVENVVIDGSLTFNADSAARRQGSLKMYIQNDLYLPSPSSFIWINKKCQVKIGLKDIFTNKIEWFNKGCYIVDQPQISVGANGQKELSLTLSDYMTYYDGTITGQLGYVLKLPIGMPVSTAMRNIFTNGGCTKFLISDDEIVDSNGNQLLIPYKLEKQETDNIFTISQELRDLYMGFELFFNENGYLVFRRKRNRLNDQTRWNFDSSSTDYFNRNLSISFDDRRDFHNIKNHIYIIGKGIDPLVAACGTDTTKDNTASKLVVYFTKPLFDINNQPLQDGKDVKNCFNYSGTASNYISAIYNNSISGFTVTFTITGEQGKALTPIENKLFDSSSLPYKDDYYEFCATDEYKWSKPNYITIDYTNNSIIKFAIKFNKPLYNSSGTKLADGADVKSLFTYSGSASNYTSATYNSDNYNNQITFIFSTGVANGDKLTINSNSIYDSAGFVIDIQLVSGFTYNNTEWSMDTLPVVSENQIKYTIENNDSNSDFSIAKIGRRDLVIKESNIFSNSQAKSRSEYELYNHDNFAEKISITNVPVYILDVNQLIYFNHPDTKVEGKYCITSITTSLKYNQNQTIEGYKIYNSNVL